MSRKSILPCCLSLAFLLINTSNLAALYDEDTFPQNIIGQTVYVEKDGELVRCKCLRVNEQTQQALLETYWQGKSRDGWVPFKDLVDGDGWPYYVPPYDVGDHVEVRIKDEWVNANVEEVRGQKIKVRLEAGNIRVVNLKDMRKPETEEELDSPIGSGDEAAQGSDGLFNAKTGDWRVIGIEHPVNPEQLEEGMTVYFVYQGLWTEGKIKSTSSSMTYVEPPGDMVIPLRVQSRELSLTKPRSYIDDLEYKSIPTLRMLHDEFDESVPWDIPEISKIPDFKKAWLKHRFRLPTRPTHRGLQSHGSSLFADTWNPRFALYQYGMHQYTTRSSFYYIGVFDFEKEQTIIDCAVPPGLIAKAVNHSGTQVALLGDTKKLKDKSLVLMDISKPESPQLHALKLTVSIDDAGRTGSSQITATYLDDRYLLLHNQVKRRVLLVDLEKEIVAWMWNCGTSISISPDAQLLSTITEKGLMIIDIRTGKLAGRIPDTTAESAYFTTDGKRLKLYRPGSSFEIIDIQSKKSIHSAFSRSGIRTVVDQYGIDQNGVIYDLNLDMPLWRITGMKMHNFVGRICVSVCLGQEGGYVIPFELPIDQLEKIAAESEQIESAKILKRGSSVALIVNVHRQSDESLRERIEKVIADNGWTIDKNAPLTIEAKVDSRRQEEVEYKEHLIGRSRPEMVTITYTTVRLLIRRGQEEELWAMADGFNNNPGWKVELDPGERVADKTRELLLRDQNLFDPPYLPKYLMKPTFAQGFGFSEISPRGLKPPVLIEANDDTSKR